MTVLFFGRYKEKYSQKIFLLLKKYFRKVDVIWSKTYNEKITKKLKSQYDYIFTFRSYLILKNNTIKKAKIAAINFHPGPPKYRGVGCANYAIYEKSKFYGVTAHLIAPQIDSGKIIDITKFEISEKISLDMLVVKRPGLGIEPHLKDKILGSTANCDIKKDHWITKEMINFK